MNPDEKIVLICGFLTLALSIYLYLGTVDYSGNGPAAIYLHGPDKLLLASAHPGPSFFYCTGTNLKNVTVPVVPNLTKISASWANPNPAEQVERCRISLDGTNWISPRDVQITGETETVSLVPWNITEGTKAYFSGCPCIGMISYITFDAAVRPPANEALCGGDCCNDDVDNDGDGFKDCADTDCLNATICETGGGVKKVEYLGEKDCNDNKDGDDADGKIDCDDPECAYSDICKIGLIVGSEESTTCRTVPSGYTEASSITLSKTSTLFYKVYVNHGFKLDVNPGTECSIDFSYNSTEGLNMEAGGNAMPATSKENTFQGRHDYPAAKDLKEYTMRVDCLAATKEISVTVPASVTGPAEPCETDGTCASATAGTAMCDCPIGFKTKTGQDLTGQDYFQCVVDGTCSWVGTGTDPGCVGLDETIRPTCSETTDCTWTWDIPLSASGSCTCIETIP